MTEPEKKQTLLQRVDEEFMPSTPFARKAGWLAFSLGVGVAFMALLMLLSFMFAILAASGALALLGLKLFFAGVILLIIAAGAVALTAAMMGLASDGEALRVHRQL